METTNLYDQDLWNQGYRRVEFHSPPADDQVRRWLETHVPRGEGTCLEVGCFPGGYLTVLGDLGYELNGIDLTPRTGSELEPWLRSRGYRVGSVRSGDFFALDESRKYDIVYSLGFIEHFTNWAEVLRKHAALVRPGGSLLVSVPNFRGWVQQALHRAFDRENLDRHHLPMMAPELWIPELEPLGFDVKWMGYFDRFFFWNGEQRRSIAQKAGLLAVRSLSPVLRALPAGNPAYAPYCGVVARRRA